MRFKLIRKLKNCPLPVGTVSGEMEYVMGIQVYRFHWIASKRYHDDRCNDVPAWMCECMPHYFKAMPTGKGGGR